MANRVHPHKNGFFWQLLHMVGITVEVRDAVDMELEGFSRQELQLILDDLYEKRTALYFGEPIGESTEAYARWDEQLFTLQDQICQVEEALELAAGDPLEEAVLWAGRIPRCRAAIMQ